MVDIIEKVARAIKNSPPERIVSEQVMRHDGYKFQVEREKIDFIQTPRSQAKAAISALADGELDEKAFANALKAYRGVPLSYNDDFHTVDVAIRAYLTALKEGK